MQNIFSIAIDGPAGAGKSFIAKNAARMLGAMYLDTGAMYRTVGLYFQRLGLLENRDEILRRLNDFTIEVKFEDGSQIMLLDGEDVTLTIREPEISMTASAMGAIPEVRSYLVALQQEIARGTSIIMDGRDIGTKVLPDATLKLYVTATAEVRAQRRYVELREKFERGEVDQKPVYHVVLDEIVERDYNDTHRAASPLERAEDAYLLDTSAMTRQQVLDAVVRLAREAIGG